jgi:hypothetical protein
MVTKLEKAVYNKQSCLGIFLDIEGAFSNATFESMIKSLRNYNVNEDVVKWISFMLRNRTALAEIHGYTKKKTVQRGCPQGGILSPLLWNMLVDTLLQQFSKYDPAHVQAYADDISVLVSGPDTKTIGSLAQHTLNLLEKWATTNHLKFAPAKTIVVMFTKKRKWTIEPLKLNGTTLHLSTQVKYLGVTLDSKLTWTPHCTNTIKKAKMILAQCRKTMSPTWGLRPYIMMWLYRQVIRPIITYASLVWVGNTFTQQSQDKLRRLQRLACLCITSAISSTPTRALEILLSLTPLHLFLRGTACRTAHRLKILGNWKGTNYYVNNSKSHIDICNRLMTDIPSLSLPIDKDLATLHLETVYIHYR